MTHDLAVLAREATEMRAQLAEARTDGADPDDWPVAYAKALMRIDAEWPAVADLVRERAAMEPTC